MNRSIRARASNQVFIGVESVENDLMARSSGTTGNVHLTTTCTVFEVGSLCFCGPLFMSPLLLLSCVRIGGGGVFGVVAVWFVVVLTLTLVAVAHGADLTTGFVLDWFG